MEKLEKKKPYKSFGRYLRVTLYSTAEHKHVNIYVSRLVYAWFNGIVDQRLVDHVVENNIYNNNYKNLQQLTPSQNIKKNYKYRKGLENV